MSHWLFQSLKWKERTAEWDFGQGWTEKERSSAKNEGGKRFWEELHTLTKKEEGEMFAKTVLGDCSPSTIEIGTE